MKLSRRQIALWARRFLRGEAIPIFADRRINRAIDRAYDAMLAARTHRGNRRQPEKE